MAKEVHATDAALTGADGPSREAVSALSRLKEEPEWMLEKRLAAWDVFAASKPTKWHYMDGAIFKTEGLASFRAAPSWEEAKQNVPDDVLAIADGETPAAGIVIQSDSTAVFHRAAADLAEQGVIFTDTDTALKEHPELVKDHFMTGGGVSMDDDAFVALHAALWSGGLFLYVPKHVEVKLPFYYFHTVTGAGLTQPHNLVILEPGAMVTLYEEYYSDSRADGEQSASFSGANTFMHLKDGSQLRLITVQRWADDVDEVTKYQAFVGRDARFSATTAVFGTGKARVHVRSELQGEGAQSDLQTMVLADGSQHVDVLNENRHLNANTHGDMLVKQVLKDNARTSFEGLIHIDNKAPQSTDYLAANALVLDKGARADAIPSLEIFNDDVQASHGATVGQIDDETVFYLMSRGVDRNKAELMIVGGFFDPLLQRVPEEDTRERLAALIADKARR